MKLWNKTEAVGGAAVLELPDPVDPVANAPDKAAVPGYSKRCMAIGALRMGVVSGIDEFIADELLSVYSVDSVAKYMDALVAKKSVGRDKPFEWCWLPVRSVDAARGLVMEKRRNKNGDIKNNKLYNKAVPLPVLEIIEKVHVELGDSVCMYITDVSDVNWDPFLAICPADGGSMHVIQRWNEPGYRS